MPQSDVGCGPCILKGFSKKFIVLKIAATCLQLMISRWRKFQLEVHSSSTVKHLFWVIILTFGDMWLRQRGLKCKSSIISIEHTLNEYTGT